MKEKIKNEYLRRTKKLLETELLSRILIKEQTTELSLVRYSELFLKWKREELKQMAQRTRKVMTMNKALHLRDDVDRRAKEKEGRGLVSIEASVVASIRQLEHYIKNAEENWLHRPETVQTTQTSAELK